MASLNRSSISFLRPFRELDSLTDVIQNFNTSWFTVSMGIGAVSLVVLHFPFHFTAQFFISFAIWCLNVAIFIACLFITIARTILFPQKVVEMMEHPKWGLYGSAFPMALSTIINGVISFYEFGVWDRKAIKVAWFLWWISSIFSIVIGFKIHFFMMTRHKHILTTMTAIWLFPSLPTLVASNTSGILASSLASLSSSKSVIATVFGYFMFSLSMPLVLGCLTILFMRLLLYGAPAKESVMSCLIPLGPLGMGSSALFNLGVSFNKIFQDGYETAVLTSFQIEKISSVLYYGGLIFGFILLSFGIFWVIIGTLLILRSVKEGITFHMGCWGLIFPIGVYTLAVLDLGSLTGLSFFCWGGAFFSVILISLCLLIFVKTVISCWTGSVFKVSTDLSNSIEQDLSKMKKEVSLRRGSV